MKQPFSKGWGVKERDSYKITSKQIIKHIKKGGWLGLPVPQGYISVDVDNKKNGKFLSEHVLPNSGLKYHVMQTPNGYQFIFEDTGKAKNDAKCLTWGGIKVDYRTVKGMMVLPLGERTEGRNWTKTDCADVDPMPILFNRLRKVMDELEPEPLLLPIPDGSHNTTLASITGRLQQAGIEDEDILSVMEMVADLYCDSPYGTGWEKPVRSVLSSYPKGEKRDGSWTDKLQKTEKDGIKSTPYNAKLFLENVIIKKSVAYNEFNKGLCIIDGLPWRKMKHKGETFGSNDMFRLNDLLATKYKIVVNEQRVKASLIDIASKNTYHPVKEFIESEDWDGKSRIETLFVRFLGAENTEYTRAINRKSILAIVTRIYNPGCKYENMTIFYGGQHLGKTSFLEALTIKGEWFKSGLKSIDEKIVGENMAGKIIFEDAELVLQQKVGPNEYKDFLSRRSETFRPAHAAGMAENFPRTWCAFGTTNQDDVLKDVTGERRFSIIRCSKERQELHPLSDEGKQALSGYELQQIYAEAYHLYKKGETLKLPDHIEKESEKIALKFKEILPYQDAIEEWLERKKYTETCTKEIFNEGILGYGITNPQKHEEMDVAKALKALGFEKTGEQKNLRKVKKARIFKKM